MSGYPKIDFICGICNTHLYKSFLLWIMYPQPRSLVIQVLISPTVTYIHSREFFVGAFDLKEMCYSWRKLKPELPEVGGSEDACFLGNQPLNPFKWNGSYYKFIDLLTYLLTHLLLICPHNALKSNFKLVLGFGFALFYDKTSAANTQNYHTWFWPN